MSLTPYINNASTTTFVKAYDTTTGVVYLTSGRPIAQPFGLEIVRKHTPPSSPGNDQVQLRLRRVEQNATTGKLASFNVTLSISIPKDQTILTPTVMKQSVSAVASLLNESTAMEATNTFITKLLEGMNPE